MGLPKGPEGQGLPEVRTSLSLTRPGSWERAEPAGRRAERGPGCVWGAPPPSQVCPPRGDLALCAGGRTGTPAWAGVGTNFSRSRVPRDGGGLPSPTPSPTQPRAPRGPGSHLSRAVSPDPRRRRARPEARGCCALGVTRRVLGRSGLGLCKGR